jgi:hypothetical protein
VLATAEAFLLGRGDDLAVDDECCGGIMENGVDTEHGDHGTNLPPGCRAGSFVPMRSASHTHRPR